MRSSLPLTLLIAVVSACAPAAEIGSFADHDEPEDLIEVPTDVPGISASFRQNTVVDDDFFVDTSVTGDEVQGFLENAPYSGGIRSWLADHRVSGMRASDALVAAAREQNLNPLLLLTRIQVEKSAISRTEPPSQRTIDYTMGCGCPDNRPCNEAYRGFDKQMACAARVLREHYDGSSAGTGAWKMGVARSTLDPISITPTNHATASLYAYTPWVLEGRGGNWLVWNVTKKFAVAMGQVVPSTDTGTPDPDPGIPDPGGPWVGDTCQSNANCAGQGMLAGECLNWYDESVGSLFGYCTYNCDGFCPDRPGADGTFCAEVHNAGHCVPVADSRNRDCRDIPGTVKAAMRRHGNGGGASVTWEDVCVPDYSAEQCSTPQGAGICVNSTTTSCSGQLVEDACPGPSEIRCCVE